MKLKIEKEFIDKYTGEKYAIGNTKEFEEERAKELLSDSRNLVSEAKEEVKKATSKKSKK